MQERYQFKHNRNDKQENEMKTGKKENTHKHDTHANCSNDHEIQKRINVHMVFF